MADNTWDESSQVALLRRCANGDEEAFGELVRLHKQAIYRLAYRFTRNREDAEDLTQETFLRAFSKRERFDPERNVRSWLMRVATNLSLNHIRSKRRGLRCLNGFAQEERDRCRPRTPDNGHQEELWAALDALKPALRAAIVLVWIEGMTHREAGAILDCSEGAVSWRVHMAKKQIRRRLAPRPVQRGPNEESDGRRIS